MMELDELQRAFQARILSFQEGIELELVGGGKIAGDGRMDFEPRLDAYVEGYRVRLLEALGGTYPVLQRTLGDEHFARRLRQYIDSTSSRHFSVRAYGADVAQYLAVNDESGRGRILGELARWEWTLADVFDAPDDQALGLDAVATVPPERWPDLFFTLRASVRRFDTATNAVMWWRAANDLCERPPDLIDAPTSHWVLWRRGVKTMFRSLDDNEAAMLDAIAGGATFGELCEQLAARFEASEAAPRAASLLRGWITEELITRHGIARAVE